jgi:WD40 repeat protein
MHLIRCPGFLLFVGAASVPLAGCNRCPPWTPPLRSLKSSGNLADEPVFSPDGKMLAAAFSDGVVRIWDPATGQETATWAAFSGPVRSFAFKPDGKWLAAAACHGDLFLWSVPDQGLRGKSTAAHRGGVTAVSFSPDGKRLASGGADGAVKLWSFAGPEGRAQQEHAHAGGHRTAVHSVAFFPDGRSLLSASGESNEPSDVILWDVQAPGGAPQRKWAVTEKSAGQDIRDLLALIEWAGFSPDGRAVITAGWGSVPPSAGEGPGGVPLAGDIRFWDAGTGRLTRTLKQEKKAGQAFSSDGKLYVTGWPWGGNMGFGARVFDLRTGEPLQNLAGTSEVVEQVAFSPDGRTVAGASKKGTIWLWDLGPPKK